MNTSDMEVEVSPARFVRSGPLNVVQRMQKGSQTTQFSTSFGTSWTPRNTNNQEDSLSPTNLLSQLQLGESFQNGCRKRKRSLVDQEELMEFEEMNSTKETFQQKELSENSAKPEKTDSHSTDSQSTRKMERKRRSHISFSRLLFFLVFIFTTILAIRLYSNHSTERDDCYNQIHDSVNLTSLKKDITKKLYGQPIVSTHLPQVIDQFLGDPSKRVLFLLFEGMSGSGKSFTTSLVMHSVDKSKSHHLVFSRELEEAAEFAPLLKPCSVHLYAFYETDERTLVTIQRMMKQLEEDNGYFKVILILESTEGSTEINNFVVNEKQRVSMEMMQNTLQQTTLYQTIRRVIQPYDEETDLVAFPFLPLSEEHVRRCIEDELRQTNKAISLKNTEAVLQEMDMHSGRGGTFSLSGCKMVHAKVIAFAQ